jgi:hypothetical protein
VGEASAAKSLAKCGAEHATYDASSGSHARSETLWTGAADPQISRILARALLALDTQLTLDLRERTQLVKSRLISGFRRDAQGAPALKSARVADLLASTG